jgi:hypothetical protein
MNIELPLGAVFCFCILFKDFLVTILVTQLASSIYINIKVEMSKPL